MSDKIPGSSWSNPIWHRGWRIYIDDCAGIQTHGYAFVHDDYDGAPDAGDDRCGWEKTLEAAKAAIDEREDDNGDV